MRKKIIAGTILAVTLSTTALAADNGSSGYYVGLSAGQGVTAATNLNSDTGNLFGVFVGKDLNRYWGIEAAYNTLGNFSGYTYSGHSNEFDVTVIGTYYFDQADTFGLYGKIGVDHTWVSANGASDGSTGGTYGFGLRYLATRQFEARIGLQYYGTGTSNPYYNHNTAGLLGVAYHF
ncbi:MAG: porin family protein [Ferrovum sp.]|nr:porin family protein [Ferrovum sp.]